MKTFLTKLGNVDNLVFIPNPGNAGDAIINCSEYKILRELGLDFLVVTDEADLELKSKNKTVLYGGGGGLVPQYNDTHRRIKLLLKISKKLIILPSTLRNCEDILTAMRPGDAILCRDLISYSYAAKNVSSDVMVLDCEDAALTLDAKQLLSEKPSSFQYLKKQLNISKYHFRVALYEYFRWKTLMAIFRLKKAFTKNKFNVNIIRRDIESTIPQPENNLDISAYLENNDMSEAGAQITAYRMLAFLDLFDVISTNRLHAAIGALLLGKFVYFHDNSYGKNRSIYERSLKNRFNKIMWQD